MNNSRFDSMIEVQPEYGIPDDMIRRDGLNDRMIEQTDYGVKLDINNDYKGTINRFSALIAILIFIIGIAAILNRKLSKKAKIAIVLGLIIIGIAVIVGLRYL